jgi:hypothetical protein
MCVRPPQGGNLTDIVMHHYHGGVIDYRFAMVVDNGLL